MSERVKWIEHKGKKILFNDYQDLKGDEYTQTIKKSEKECLNSGMKTVYVINDVTNSFMNDETFRVPDIAPGTALIDTKD